MTFFQRMCAYLEYARTQKPPHYYTAGVALRRLRGQQRSERCYVADCVLQWHPPGQHRMNQP